MKNFSTIYCLLLFTLTLYGHNNDSLDVNYNIKSSLDSRFPLKPSSVWKVGFLFNQDSTQNHHGNNIFRYFLYGDTLINSTSYYKLYKSGTAYYDTTFSYKNIYVGAIRDSSNKFFYIEKKRLWNCFCSILI
jgi:hypothetical protein